MFLTVTIRKPSERVEKPDAVYSVEVLGRFGSMYADGDWLRKAPISDLVAFAKARK